MKSEEAIERIERNICSHMDWCRYRDCEHCEVELAIEALEKQIPKKPVKLNCPRCRFNGIDNSWWVFPYCPECGQRLNWEGIE